MANPESTLVVEGVTKADVRRIIFTETGHVAMAVKECEGKCGRLGTVGFLIRAFLCASAAKLWAERAGLSDEDFDALSETIIAIAEEEQAREAQGGGGASG